MRYGSVCSGIEAATVAWHSLGWKAAWLSEIEPFPSAVLAHHYPNTLNLGDMTLLSERIASGEIEAPDVFCGGTPCQAFSVAGLRNSLDDHRGNLSLTFCEIANAIDSVRIIRGEKPAIIFWENVPGVLNTKDNAFGCFLAGLAGESDALISPGGRWTDAGFIDGPQRAIAWRVLDAQYFGLAQRRKRVFVVASARNDFDPATVLFEWDGLRRDIAPSRETGQNITKPITDSVGALCARDYKGVGNQYVAEGKVLPVWWNGGNLAATITTKSDDQRMPDKANAQLIMQQVYENHPADSRVKEMGDTCATVTSRWGTGGGNVPFVQQAYSIREDAKANTFSATPLEVSTCVGSLVPSVQSHHAQTFVAHSVAFEPGIAKREGNPSRFVEEMSPTLRSDMGDNQVAVAIQPLVLEDQGGSVISTSQTGIVGTLRRESHGHEPSVLSFNHAQQSMMVGDEIASPLMQRDFKDPQTVLAPTLTASNDPSRSPQSTEVTNQVAAVYATTMAVRRLTPVECERLQGFPDNYTNIPWRKKPESPDGPRYKALGNSWAVPVVAWIGKRINDAVA
jgi:DNA-cytosine methyltransferase